MTEHSDNLQRIKELLNPALQAEAWAAYVRGLHDDLRDEGVPVTSIVQTFEQAGIASAGEGILVTDSRLGLEIRCTIGPEFTMDVAVRAISETNKLLATLLQAVSPFLVRLAGMRAIPKGD